MPCLDGSILDDQSMMDYQDCKEPEDYMKSKIHKLTQNLCYLCGELTSEERLDILNPRIQEWWHIHQQDDDNRVRAEMRKTAHAYSTPEDMAQSFIKKAEDVYPVSNFHKKWFNRLAQETWDELPQKKQRRWKRQRRRL